MIFRGFVFDDFFVSYWQSAPIVPKTGTLGAFIYRMKNRETDKLESTR